MTFDGDGIGHSEENYLGLPAHQSPVTWFCEENDLKNEQEKHQGYRKNERLVANPNSIPLKGKKLTPPRKCAKTYLYPAKRTNRPNENRKIHENGKQRVVMAA